MIFEEKHLKRKMLVTLKNAVISIKAMRRLNIKALRLFSRTFKKRYFHSLKDYICTLKYIKDKVQIIE